MHYSRPILLYTIAARPIYCPFDPINSPHFSSFSRRRSWAIAIKHHFWIFRGNILAIFRFYMVEGEILPIRLKQSDIARRRICQNYSDFLPSKPKPVGCRALLSGVLNKAVVFQGGMLLHKIVALPDSITFRNLWACLRKSRTLKPPTRWTYRVRRRTMKPSR